MIGDTRTNAGVDNIATFRKLHLFETPGERAIGFASAGNLSVAQSVLSDGDGGLPQHRERRGRTADGVDTMFGAAQLVGRADPRSPPHRQPVRGAEPVRRLRRDDPARRPGQGRPAAPVHDLLGRQLHRGDRRHALSPDRRAQIRQADPRPLDHGRDRARRRPEARPDLDGFDHPLEPQRRPADRHPDHPPRRPPRRDRLPDRRGEPYFHDLREKWSSALRDAHQAIPPPPYPSR